MTSRLMAFLARHWRAATGSAGSAAVALGLLACLCTLLAVVGPRAGAQLRTGAFRQFVARAPAEEKAVIGTVDDNTLGIGQPQGLDAAQIQQSRGQLRQNLTGLPLAPAAADMSSLTTPLLIVTDSALSLLAPLPPKLELTYRDTLAANARVVAGRLPAGTQGRGSTVVVQAAITEPTARRFGLAVGSRLALPGTGIVLTVTGIVAPRDPAALFWTVDSTAATPDFESVSPDVGYWAGAVFIPASAVNALQTRVDTLTTQVTWTFPLSLGRLTAAQAAQLQAALAKAFATGGHLDVGGGGAVPILITLSSGAGQLISAFGAQAGAVGSVLDLLAVSLAVLAAVVVLLAGWLLTEQRRQEFALLRARGAARRQLALAMLTGCAVTVLPGAAVGAVIAIALTPSAPASLSWWLAGLEVFAALAGPAAMTIRMHRGYAATARPDQPAGRLWSARRLVVESALVLGVAGGLLVLRDQGLGAGRDVYPSAAPALLAIGVAVVVVRVYPAVVRGVLRLTGQRASAAAFLGLARAARVSATAALPAFALVLALALASFAGMVRGAVVAGETTASWQQAGADVVISQPGPVSQALQRAVAAVPGVQHVAAAGVTVAHTPEGLEFDVLTVDPGQYAALVAGTPLPRTPAAFVARGAAGAGAAAVPGLASPSLAAELPGGRFGAGVGYQHVEVRVVGQAASLSAVGTVATGYLVLPSRSLGAGATAPTMLLVVGPALDTRALAAAVARHGAGATIVLRSRLLAGLQDAPLQHGADVALALGGIAAACCGLLVLLLSLLLSAPSRESALARMSVMGLSVGQRRLVTVIEALPQLLAVLVGGLASAAALVPLIGPALSLSVFTGEGASVPVRIEPGWLVAAAAGLLVLAAATLAGQTMATSREAARSLRMEGGT